MSLPPEHRADLYKSGLTDATIAACQFEGVRPSEIKNLPGVVSAYWLPYFNLDGTRNCFGRLKLFPAITTKDGHHQKYWQAPGSDPQLYLSPLVDWGSIARDASIPIIIAEGEKKGAAGCQYGLIAAAVGGVWNFRIRLETGESITLPILDQFLWKGRLVELTPDSDGWWKEKMMDVLSGLFALGMQLVARGATVRFVQLPGPAGVKVGLDDWLVGASPDGHHLWPKLKRIPLDDRSLKTVAHWWQGWRAKQAEQDALRKQQEEPPEIREAGGLYTVSFRAYQVHFLFESLHESHSSIKAELTVKMGTTPPPLELMSGMDLSLKADRSQKDLAAQLKARSPAIPWRVLLPLACAVVVKHYRAGEPTILLSVESVAEPFTYQMNPFVPQDNAGSLFGDGGLGKSTILLAVGLCCSVGGSVAGLSAMKGVPLYLDYETTEATHIRRLHKLLAGHPELAGATVRYERCTRPLPAMLPHLRRLMSTYGTTLLLVDSMIGACGGNLLDTEMTNRYYMALRQLRVGSLTIAHQPKNLDGQAATMYGNAFQSNLSRNVWEVQKQQEAGERELVLGFSHRKANDDHLRAPFGMNVTYSEDQSSLTLASINVADYVDLALGLPLKTQIQHALKSGGKTAKELAEDLDTPVKIIRACLSKGVDKWCTKLGEREGEIVWGLRS
jgi:hypothetical protein